MPRATAHGAHHPAHGGHHPGGHDPHAHEPHGHDPNDPHAHHDPHGHDPHAHHDPHSHHPGGPHEMMGPDGHRELTGGSGFSSGKGQGKGDPHMVSAPPGSGVGMPPRGPVPRQVSLDPRQQTPQQAGRKFPPPRGAPSPIQEDLYPADAEASGQLQEQEEHDERFGQDRGGGMLLDRESLGLDPPPAATADATKSKKVRQALMEKLKNHSENRVTNPLYGETKLAARFCCHPFFEPVCLIAICFNALWIGYSTDQQDPDGKEPPNMYKMTDYGFCFFFSVEILLRIAAYRSPLSFFFDPVQRSWNLFDFMLVCFLIGETWMLPMVSKGGAPDLPALSSMRLLRMLRMVRVLRMVPELAMMVRSLMAAIRSVAMTGVLAVGIMYIFSIILTQWARSHTQKWECSPPSTCINEAFGSIPKSFLTLMQILCFDASFALIRAVLDERMPYGLLLLLFILIVAFTVLNMLIGVVCQIVATTSENERNAAMKQKVEALFRLLEIESTGFISRKELERNKHVLHELDKVGVDQELLSTSLNIIDRKMANRVGDPGHLDLEEFLEVVFKLLHPPQTQDILLVQSKLAKLEKALAATGMSQADEAAKSLKKSDKLLEQADDERIDDMDEGTRMAVESSLWELESQVTSMLTHAMETTGRAEKPQPGANWDVELRRLDAAMCRLRVRLERCQDEAGPVPSSHQAVQLASNELQYWRKLCGEVVQSISAASTLMAQAVREADAPTGPDGMFRGSGPQNLMQAAAAAAGHMSEI